MKNQNSNNNHLIIQISKLAFTSLTLIAAVWMVACGGSGGDPQFFVKKGCTECHSVSVYGFESQNKSGPDLALAVEDVQKRFGKDLDSFLIQPVGTMQMVLSQKIKLTDAERQEAIALLKEAYKKKTGK